MLSEAQVEQYHRDGYTVYQGLFGPAELHPWLAEIERISEGNTFAAPRYNARGDGAGPAAARDAAAAHLRTLHLLSSRSATCRNPESCWMRGAVAGRRPGVSLQQDQHEAGGDRLVVDWHQDLAYYPLTNSDSVSILIYLDDASRANGCLQVLPGRHRAGPLSHSRNGYFQGRIVEPVEESEAVALEASAGSVIFMHCLTPHASVANTSRQPRRTLILSYRASDAYPVYTGEGTVAAESHVRQVRGVKRLTARFSFSEFPIPRQRQRTRSLYELQELSRAGGKLTIRP